MRESSSFGTSDISEVIKNGIIFINTFILAEYIYISNIIYSGVWVNLSLTQNSLSRKKHDIGICTLM